MSWKLALQMAGKKFGLLGDELSKILASWDPETATQVDRDNLQAKLNEFANKVANAESEFTRERKEATDLAELIRKDEAALSKLEDRLAAGTIDEETVNLFLDQLEANRQQLPVEEQEAKEAEEILAAYKDLFTQVRKRIDDFDRAAAQAKRQLQSAQAQLEKQSARQEQQAELRAASSGLGSVSTGLGALGARAAELQKKARAAELVADAGQAPIDRQKAIDDIRASVSGDGAPAGESALERLKRLRGGQAPVAASAPADPASA